MNYTKAFLLCLFLISGVYVSCKLKSRKVKSIVLFDTGSINTDKEPSLQDLQQLKKIVYDDQKIIDLVNTAHPTNKMIIWKGRIYGAFVYSNNDTSLVYFSRYGGFFYHDGKTYIFDDKQKRDEMIDIIDKFWEQVHRTK